ncbi:MAG: hypothetical protein JXB88_03200 [Spirochaetales bacterium]|nr:hypothetical protein [Spirochaetales bacterium]
MVLYKDNLLANKIEIPDHEMAGRFFSSKFFTNWQDGLPLSRVLPAFIMNEYNATYDFEDYMKLENTIRNGCKAVQS